MKQRALALGLLAAVLSITLAACGGGAESAATPAPAAQPPATVAPLPTVAAPTSAVFELGVSGIGEVKATQDADLVFQVQGTVAEVRVREGDTVKQGDLLATLDVRGFDQQLQQAEAQLKSATAAQAGLTEEPRSYDAAAANAAVRQAEAALEAVKNGPKPQDIATAQAAVTAAEANLQSSRDRLSQAKTAAELQMKQAVQALTQAQARFAQAKSNLEYAEGTGNDPFVPSSTNPTTGKKADNELSDGQLQNYQVAYQTAEAAMRQAEEAVRLAQVSYDAARQTEVTGVQAAEQQLEQARLALEKLQLPPDKDRLAGAEAALAQAQANRAKLSADPRESQAAQAEAAVAQAEAALELARINRERAELRAPFDGIVATVNVDPGDPSTVQNGPAIRVVNVSDLRIEVQISDTDVARIAVGDTADIVADAIPDQTFEGTVSFISPVPVVSGTIRSYKVRIDPKDAADLRAGMSVRVEFPTE